MTGAMRRRLLRILLNAATVLSLLLCVATIVLWVRSYWVGSYLRCVANWDPGHMQNQEDWTAMSCTGELNYTWSRQSLGPHPEKTVIPVSNSVRRFETPMTPGLRANWGVSIRARYLGFGYSDHKSTTPLSPPPNPATHVFTLRAVAVPYWGVTVLLALLPGVRGLSRWRRRKALTGNHCQVCGYDLRATPGRCPECGTAVAPAGPAREGKRETEGV
jgi:hypothetical protein